MGNSDFLHSDGNMGALIREKDWSGNPLGPIRSWPQSLKTSLSLLLNSGFPGSLYWGPEHICFYNDAFRRSMRDQQKHPALLGARASEGWAELWQVLKPVFDQVLSGKSFWKEDEPTPFFIKNNKQTFGTFSFAPVCDETDRPAAVCITCYETTEKINVLKKTADEEEQINFLPDSAELGTWDLDPHTGLLSKERLKASIEAQEKERELIANELHDNVNQLLASTKLYLGMIKGKDEKAKTFVATCSEYIDRCMTEIRNISHGLNPSVLHFIGLSRSIRDMVGHLNQAGHIRFRFAERRNAKTSDDNQEVELAIFRITQIQVANILKHSRARSARISLLYCHRFVELTVSDDGNGFDMTKSKKGLGLLNILNRAELLQGTVSLVSEPMQGCTLKVRIPWSGVHRPLPAESVFSAH